MDIAKHKKEMEELHALAQFAKENPKLANKKIASENFTMIPIGGEQQPFPWKKFFNRVGFINDHVDTIETIEDKKLLAKYRKQRKEMLTLAENFPYGFDSKEQYLKMLRHFPKGLSWDETTDFIDLISYSEYAIESTDIWKEVPFNDTFYDIKECLMLEFDSVETEGACSFSFTDKMLDSQNGFQAVIDNFGPMDKVDVNNVLFIIRAYDTEVWKIPEGFELQFIASISSSQYSFAQYDDGPDTFIKACRNIGLDKVAEFLESYHDERLIPTS